MTNQVTPQEKRGRVSGWPELYGEGALGTTRGKHARPEEQRVSPRSNEQVQPGRGGGHDWHFPGLEEEDSRNEYLAMIQYGGRGLTFTLLSLLRALFTDCCSLPKLRVAITFVLRFWVSHCRAPAPGDSSALPCHIGENLDLGPGLATTTSSPCPTFSQPVCIQSRQFIFIC